MELNTLKVKIREKELEIETLRDMVRAAALCLCCGLQFMCDRVERPECPPVRV